MLSNVDYHKDRTHLNSSALKLLLKSPAQFYAEWFLGLREESNATYFDEGSLTHTLILEPHKVAQEYAFYDGLRKQGERFKTFAAENGDKKILSIPQRQRCESYVEAWRARVEAVHMLQGGVAEQTITATLHDVPVKARADYINIEKGYIVDVKTTSMPVGIEFFKSSIFDYGYDLSASLYAQIAEQVHKKPFDFYFMVISKPDNVCDIYKASRETMAHGNAKLTQALVLYKQCLATGQWILDQGNASYVSNDYEILEV